MESLEEFYQHKFKNPPKVRYKEIGMFDVFSIEENIKHNYQTPPYVRRDFYKIMLFEGENVFHYGDESVAVKDSSLLFFNPFTPYSYETLKPDTKGYFCVFKEEFFTGNLSLNLKNLSLFKPKAKPVYELSGHFLEEVHQLFAKMIKEMEGHYDFKYELIKSYISEIIFNVLKYNPLQVPAQSADAGARITSVFLELLDRQFPVQSTSHQFTCRTPADFADHLAVHVNYLNRVLKTTTGKTTTEHIAEHLLAQAKTLLKYTNWNIAEISYALGYEEQSHFNSFFKKHTKYSPTEFRNI
ncbi:helix-turn-helix transcriptional regulator [Fulvivirga ligni]|uniref:helix-turn-helix transcriptional regulator n=1 Tax=Fulvivirga ligni TaxID=2904246 RepID=UPI001F44D40E|nr:helix-turn-helix transcriptional regulator [Fulvivirga ligni]UII19003.1 helix-turn-helix transcriptional regulator [Fulvivirga ligni]